MQCKAISRSLRHLNVPHPFISFMFVSPFISSSSPPLPVPSHTPPTSAQPTEAPIPEHTHVSIPVLNLLPPLLEYVRRYPPPTIHSRPYTGPRRSSTDCRLPAPCRGGSRITCTSQFVSTSPAPSVFFASSDVGGRHVRASERADWFLGRGDGVCELGSGCLETSAGEEGGVGGGFGEVPQGEGAEAGGHVRGCHWLRMGGVEDNRLGERGYEL